MIHHYKVLPQLNLLHILAEAEPSLLPQSPFHRSIFVFDFLDMFDKKINEDQGSWKNLIEKKSNSFLVPSPQVSEQGQKLLQGLHMHVSSSFSSRHSQPLGRSHSGFEQSQGGASVGHGAQSLKKKLNHIIVNRIN